MKIWDYKSSSLNDTLSKQVENNSNIIYTSSSMAKHLLETIDFKEGDRLLEPCLGSGAFYNNFPEYTINDWCEINKNKDFFDYKDKVDYIISNPPYVPRKLFWSFHQHAMGICEKNIYWLINLASLNVFTPKRLNEMKNKGWYIQSFYIVQDPRWFGRYSFVKFGKEDKGIFNWTDKKFIYS